RTAPAPAVTQTSLAASQRPIRRDIPITNTIRRAFAAGTRDSSGQPGARYWQQWMEYEINARLDVPTSTITGRENVTLHNKTVAVVALQRPIPARSSTTLAIEWSFKVPGVNGVRGQRMGRFADTLYQVAQWYPRVTVYDDLRGWDVEPYLGDAEFYNNFGKWDVTLDVPAGWLVGATGTLQNANTVLSGTTRERLTHVLESDAQRTIVGASDMGAGRATATGDRLLWRFTADTANDFAWATSRSYVWDATRASIPDRGYV